MKLKQYYKVNQMKKEVSDAEEKYKFTIKENNFHYENYVQKMVPMLEKLQS